jgi:hypothetical protein
MKIPMNIKKQFGIIIVLLLFVIAIVILANPLRRSPETLRYKMLKKTPIGMEMGEVEKIAKEIGGRTEISTIAGFDKQDPNDHRTIGAKSIRTDVGDYWAIPPLPIITSVTYFWGFDENGKLVDIWVWKTTDAP